MNKIIRIITSVVLAMTFVALTFGVVVAFIYYNFQLIIDSLRIGSLAFEPILVLDLILFMLCGNILQISRT